MESYENLTAFNLSKCNNLEECPVGYRSLFSLIPTLSIIGNVSKSTGILLLNGENDSLTPVQQAFLLQQRTSILSFISVGDSKWSNTTVCVSRYLLMAGGSFWSFTFLCYYCLHYGSKYKFIEYKYDFSFKFF
jgi:hypothetical protein